jgi:hypothetical protein
MANLPEVASSRRDKSCRVTGIASPARPIATSVPFVRKLAPIACLLGLLLAGCGSSSPDTGKFSVRPVLCYAPPYMASPRPQGGSRALPACSSQSRLTAQRLNVTPSGNGAGYTSNMHISPDPAFSKLPSTPYAEASRPLILLPANRSTGTTNRFVLGPAELTASSIKSASVQSQLGQWVVKISLTSDGAIRWDSLARTQFHALVAVVVRGRVIEAPLIQPGQYAFTSFSGRFAIAGDLTRAEAGALAAELQP